MALSSRQKQTAAPACHQPAYKITSDVSTRSLLQDKPGPLSVRKELVKARRDGGLRKAGLRVGCVTLGSRPAPTPSTVNQRKGARGCCGDPRK